MIENLAQPIAKSMVQNAILSSISNLERLQTLFTDAAATEGGAYNFADSTKVFQDNFLTVPVTTTGDVIGGVTDDSGLDNPIGQSTVASKPQWIENEGLQSIDSADYLIATASGALTDFTLVIYAEDAGNVAETLFQHYNNSNNQFRVRKITPDIQGNTVQAGTNVNITIKSAPTSGTDNVIVFRFDSAASNEIWGQFNNEAAVTGTRAGTPAWGINARIGGDSSTGGITAPLKRIIFMNKILSGADLALAKTLVQNGW